MAGRVDRVIARVRAVPGNVACVAHGHVLRVLAARWVGLARPGARYFVLGPASVERARLGARGAGHHVWNQR